MGLNQWKAHAFHTVLYSIFQIKFVNFHIKCLNLHRMCMKFSRKCLNDSGNKKILALFLKKYTTPGKNFCDRWSRRSWHISCMPKGKWCHLRYTYFYYKSKSQTSLCVFYFIYCFWSEEGWCERVKTCEGGKREQFPLITASHERGTGSRSCLLVITLWSFWLSLSYLPFAESPFDEVRWVQISLSDLRSARKPEDFPVWE